MNNFSCTCNYSSTTSDRAYHKQMILKSKISPTSCQNDSQLKWALNQATGRLVRYTCRSVCLMFCCSAAVMAFSGRSVLEGMLLHDLKAKVQAGHTMSALTNWWWCGSWLKLDSAKYKVNQTGSSTEKWMFETYKSIGSFLYSLCSSFLIALSLSHLKSYLFPGA